MTVLETHGLSERALRREQEKSSGKDALALAQQMAGRARSKSKYRNVRTVVDGISFHSKREAKAWGHLRMREVAGQIRDLKRQVPFKLCAYGVNGEPVYCTTYIADFQYFDVNRKRVVVSDAKGVRTALFNIKAKMLKACHGIEVELV